MLATTFTILSLFAAESLQDADRITYTRDVAPILAENCVVCHRPGEPAPMSLTSYEEVRPWGKSIRKMVASRQMPPWHADPAVGQWKNDRRLTAEQIETVVAWIDGGLRRGNPADLAPLPKFESGWTIGEPDLVLKATEQLLPPELEDEYRYVVVGTGFKEDRWIRMSQIRPGNADVVHHVVGFSTTPDTLAGMMNDGDVDGASIFAAYAPGLVPLDAGDGRAWLIEAGSILVLQMHYHKESGLEEQDQTTIGIRFADGPISKRIRLGSVESTDFVIPAGASNYRIDAETVWAESIHIEQIIPHMHLRGQSMDFWLETPEGQRHDLLSVPKYDFNWQTFYECAEPLSIPKGTKLFASAIYDNSADNPVNPDPTADVRFGFPTTDEMMYCFFFYTRDDEQLGIRQPADGLSGGGE